METVFTFIVHPAKLRPENLHIKHYVENLLLDQIRRYKGSIKNVPVSSELRNFGKYLFTQAPIRIL